LIVLILVISNASRFVARLDLGFGNGAMSYLVLAGSVILIAVVLVDAYEVMLLPRRISRSFRFTPLFSRYMWVAWVALAMRIPAGKRRESFLSSYGPLFILLLFAAWAMGLIASFTMVHWALGTPLTIRGQTDFFTYFYYSGVTFFTLGYGDFAPTGYTGRILAVLESGIGFGFLAVVISYLPVLYQAFSRREVMISLFDARAGSPPTAAQLLLRIAPLRNFAKVEAFLAEWERWSAELLESHLSFPVLSFYRSQHDNQSWLATLTAILDTSALVIAGVEGVDTYQAQLTFAMARHVAVDLAQVFRTPPLPPTPDRLASDRFGQLRAEFEAAGLDARDGLLSEEKLKELRGLYEPFLNGLSRYFLLAVPPIFSDKPPVDNWQTSAWMRRARGIGKLARSEATDDHDDY
jgi:Ion channel